MTMATQFSAGLTLILLLAATSDAADPLKAAKELASTKYKDWKYGTGKDQIDCTQFLLATMEQCVPQGLSKKTRAAILIANLTEEEKTKLSTLIESGYPKTKGIQSALVEAGLGMAIDPKDAQPGDLIQYWMKPKDSPWFGHSGILEEVTGEGADRSATIFGSHKSQNGIGTSKFKLKLTGDPTERRIYIARLKS